MLPTQGTVKVNGRFVDGPCRDAAVVFQDYALFPWMTALKNVRFSLSRTAPSLPAGEVRRRSERALEAVDMLAAADKHPYQMSGGMRQRVAIARALALDTDILLLDEPFGALDARIRMELQNLLEDLWKNGMSGGLGTPGAEHERQSVRKTVVFVTHDIPEAVRMADRIVYMQPGRIVEEIPVNVKRPRTVLDDASVFEMKRIRRYLTERMIDDAGERGRRCACGGPV